MSTGTGPGIGTEPHKIYIHISRFTATRRRERKKALMSFCVMFTGFTIYKTINKLNPYHVTALFSNYFEISHVGFGWLVVGGGGECSGR